jgi:imidazoleglycerol-phosphate dehydratase
MKNLGITWQSEKDTLVSLERRTRESVVSITVEDGSRRDFKLSTGIDFFNHMLETVAWRACLNIDAQYENTQFRLTHVITEDTGIVLGMAFAKLIELKSEKGVNGAGSGIMGIDEALSIANVSFEGRSVATLNFENAKGASIVQVEDALAADMAEFFRGFAQGARATVNIQALSGDDPHHTWEAIYRSFGLALKESLTSNSWRAGTTAGVKGTLL